MFKGTLVRAMVLALCLTTPVTAQDLFSPIIVVNDRAVTAYELDQRIRLLEAFGTPGDLPEAARGQLVEDRLKQQELERVGAVLTEEGLAAALEDFAARAGLSGEEFVARLAGEGIAYESLRDYVAVNVTWRDYIRARFGAQVEVTEEDIDQQLAQEAAGTAGVEVLLSEIIIPAPPGREAEADAVAQQISQIRSQSEFEAAAREVSAVPSRERGGQLDWAPVSNYPGPLQEILLGLAPGEVTPPLPLNGAVALLQLRDVRETDTSPVEAESVDYAMVRIPGGLSREALTQAATIAARVDTCTDLFGQGIPDANITRATVAPAALSQDVALDLAKLDPNEMTWGRTTEGGQVLILTMLCARTYPLPEGADGREDVAGLVRSERLNAYSDALVADLRAAATIIGE
jgi:peptidyl-prolyl cis-trans isomerase SurA